MEQLVRLHDAPAPALDLQPDPRTGNLRIRYPLTWVGVREYDGAPFGREGRVRIAHLPQDVEAPSFLAALRAMPATIGHPQRVDDAGRVVKQWVHADADRLPALPAGEEWAKPRDVAAGWVGDEIALEEVRGVRLPVGTVTAFDVRARELVQAGARESSLGYQALIDWTPGIYVAPDGTEETYDGRHILDLEDPRVLAHPERESIGPNHFAYAIWAGRGGELSRMLDAGEMAGTGRLFKLRRLIDDSGVSGTGIVACGVEWPDGSAVLHWLSDEPTTTMFPGGAAQVKRIHGHGGHTVLEWCGPGSLAPEVEEPEPTPLKIEVETEIEIPGGAPAPAYAGGVSTPAKIHKLQVGPKTAEAVRAKVADAMVSIEVPDEMAAQAETLLMHIEQGFMELAGQMAGLQQANAELATANEAMAAGASEAEAAAQEIADLQARIAELEPKAAAMDAAEAKELAKLAEAHGVKVGDASTPDAVRAELLKGLAPKSAERAIALGPETVRTCLDSVLAVRPVTGGKSGLESPEDPPKVNPAHDSGDGPAPFHFLD